MPFGRRLLVLLVVLTVVAIPAGALRAVCAGRSCRGSEKVAARVPFCPLPDPLKAAIAAGYRAGRSPDVLAVIRTADLWGGTREGRAEPSPAWPSVSGGPIATVPIAFAGTGVTPRAHVPNGTGLDAIAPTLAEILGFARPHPEVRAGTAVAGIADGARPRLVLEVAWNGIGSQDLRADPAAWPFLRSLMRAGAGTLDGDTGSLPLDPAATLTTIGTGGLPSQHGIIGTFLRNDQGRLTRAWGRGAPLSVIATLPDDLDQAMGQRPLIGLVATDPADRGIIGGNWYLAHDRDRVVVAPGSAARAAAAAIGMLGAGFGRDGVPDVLAVVVRDSIPRMDAALRRIVEAARRAAGGSVSIAVTATGSDAVSPVRPSVSASEVARQVEAAVPGGGRLIEAAVPGGLFLNQARLAAHGITGEAAIEALLKVTGPDGEPVMADAFQGFAVSFARYC